MSADRILFAVFVRELRKACPSIREAVGSDGILTLTLGDDTGTIEVKMPFASDHRHLYLISRVIV